MEQVLLRINPFGSFLCINSFGKEGLNARSVLGSVTAEDTRKRTPQNPARWSWPPVDCLAWSSFLGLASLLTDSSGSPKRAQA